MLERSEGNPLYAEEIVAAGSKSLPDQLSDLFLARVDALAEGPRELVRAASVDGTRLDTDTLSKVAGIAQPRLDAFLHDLLYANVLRGVGGFLEFRHGLLREAVYDDLLPDERTRLHSEIATILEAQVDSEPAPHLSTLSRLAFHWSAAHDLPRALQASERAGMLAGQVGAVESVTHFERVLSIWDQVPDAEAVAGRSKIDLVLALGKAVFDQGNTERWHEINTRAVELLEPNTPPLVACLAHSSLAYSTLYTGDPSVASQSIRLALEYAGEHPPTSARTPWEPCP